jgi:diguanylate cyclase (GGDEF)-like protein
MRLRRGLPLWLLFFGIAIALVLLMQGFVVQRVVPQVETAAREAIDESLRAGRDVWQRRWAERAEDQAGRVALIVKDQGFLEVLNPPVAVEGGIFGDEYRDTLASALANFKGRADYDLAIMADSDGRPLLVEPAGVSLPAGALEAAVAGLRERGAAPRRGKSVPAAAAPAVIGGVPYRLVMVDLGTQDRQRWLVAGFRLEGELAALQQDLRVEASLLAGAAPNPRLVASTLADAPDRQAVSAAAADAVQARSERHVWRLHGVPLPTVGDTPLVLRLSRSLDSAEAAGASIRRDLWAAGGLALAGFALLLWALSRHFVTAGLAELVAVARRVGAQDYDADIRVSGPVREVRQLAGALDQMRRDLRAEEYFDRRLTQLPNRLYLRRELERACAGGQPVAVLLVGLNRFKEVNRRIGHAAGDRFLQATAERLQDGLGPKDFVARLGGDLFAVLLPDTGMADAVAAAQRIGRRLEQPLELSGHRVDRQAAIGIACAPAHADQAEALLTRAEIALYAAKDRRESLTVYDAALDRESEANLALLSELRHARDNGELRLHLQPKVSLRTGAVAGAEALLRWEHPQRGLVPPGRFIPYAEDTPIIKDLTLWVFEAVARDQAQLRERGIASVSINLSARDLMDLDLPEKLDALLRQHGASAGGLCLETTESAVMADIERARSTLQRLREQGFKLSIDDFGEGQTSMRYLKDLPVHELKIDMVFVKGMLTDRRTESIVRALVEVGHEYGLSVVAEGVENAQAAQRLAELGCDEGQGWHFGRPMPLPELVRWAEAYRAGLPASAAVPA